MPDLERPPTYASVDPRHQTVDVNHSPDPNATFDNLSGHTLELHRAQDHARGSGIHVKNQDNTLYYVGHYNSKQSSDIILYGGYDSNGPWLAQADFESYTKDFKVYIGDQKTPSDNDWDIVRCAGGGIFSDPSFRFESRNSGGKTRLYWKKTHDPKLGASRLSPRDYKLVDEATEEVVAVYAEKHMGSGAVKGSINYRRKVDPRLEMASLMVLLSLLEKSRRYMQHVSRAFPNTNSY